MISLDYIPRNHRVLIAVDLYPWRRIATSGFSVAGDHITRGGCGPTNRVVGRPIEIEAPSAVAQRDHAAWITADEVAGDNVATGVTEDKVNPKLRKVIDHQTANHTAATEHIQTIGKRSRDQRTTYLDQQYRVIADSQRVLTRTGLSVAIDCHRTCDSWQRCKRADRMHATTGNVEGDCISARISVGVRNCLP